ncbi:MAG: hypothetical protein ACRD4M_08325 [Candidatus Acidiferrales bacterium]
MGIAIALLSWAYFVITPSPSSDFGLVLVIIAEICIGIALWQLIEWPTKVKVPVFVALLATTTALAHKWVTYETRPSFTFLVPAVVVNGNSWDFIVNHRGPKSSKSVQILFIDDDRRKAILTAHPQGLAPQDIESYQKILTYPEVDPDGRGQIFALQFIWTPLVLDHEHYTFEITDSEHWNIHQEVEVERVRGKWFWATQITDSENRRQLLNCRDVGFPYGSGTPIPCFPKVNDPAN